MKRYPRSPRLSPLSVAVALATGASSYAAILVDFYDLKGINDNPGHAAGDGFLIKVANARRASVRETPSTSG